ncbi:MAG: hypothetical protein WED07_14740 [Candidatus Freyarchaeum deiterrae]
MNAERTVKDSEEHPHDYPSRLDWKESWYFTYMDPRSKICGIFYISTYPNNGRTDYLTTYLIDGKVDGYMNTTGVSGKLSDITDGKLKFELVKPNKKWNVFLETEKFNMDFKFNGRFPPFRFDPNKAYVKDVLEQEHYEQSCKVNGTIRFSDGTSLEVDCYGHRDHSWGLRDYSKITKWDWMQAQFDDYAMNIIRLTIGKKTEISGFVSNKKGNIEIVDTKIETQYMEDQKTPRTSTYLAIDENGRSKTIQSKKIYGIVYPPCQSKEGIRTDIYENFSEFAVKGEKGKGYGISEYLLTVKV